MPLRDSKLPSAKSGRRTNSLGRARIDCHTCLQLGKCCDRQRPRCGTCAKSRRDCGGFKMDLVWKDPKCSAQSPKSDAKEPGWIHGTSNESQVNGGNQKEFKFVKDRRKLRRKPQPTTKNGKFLVPSNGFFVLKTSESLPSAVPPFHESSPLFCSDSESMGHENEDDVSSHGISVHTPFELTGEDAMVMETTSERMFSDVSEDSKENSWKGLSTLACVANEQRVVTADYASTILDANYLTYTGQAFVDEFPLSPGILFRDLAHKFDSILTLYNQEYCVLPLTMDCSTNPFRSQENGWEGSEYLLHAMLAISSHHLSQKEKCPVLKMKMYDHQSMAIHLFSKALFRSSLTRLLDTLLILVNFQATQSAFGTWNMHLMGAQKILHAMGVMKIRTVSPRIRAQIAILVWWDITVALIYRREPVLPEAYLQTLKYDHMQVDGWTFFVLNGCPAQLAIAMRQLARLASIYGKSSNTEWTAYHTTSVEIIMEQVTCWKNDEDKVTDEAAYIEEDMDARHHRFHCIEAWRYAILLYARRVFVQRQDACGLRSISFFARETLDHVRCIPRTVIVQKQVLLPVFLAGAEAGDELIRDFVRNYCSYWSEKSGHFMFNTASALLEVIWADWDPSNREVYWWGTKVNKPAVSSSTLGEQALTPELLLG